jgi:hypothetical protein
MEDRASLTVLAAAQGEIFVIANLAYEHIDINCSHGLP